MRIRARNARISAAPVSKRPKGTHLWILPSHLQRVFYEKLTAPLVAAAKPTPGVVEELRGSKAAGLNLWADPSAEWARRKYDILLDRPLHAKLMFPFNPSSPALASNCNRCLHSAWRVRRRFRMIRPVAGSG